MTLIQIRIDDDLKEDASRIFQDLGLDLSAAIRMFLKKSVQTRGIPFDVRLNSQVVNYDTARKIMMECGEISKRNGNANMTIEEIDAEIEAYRKSQNGGKNK